VRAHSARLGFRLGRRAHNGVELSSDSQRLLSSRRDEATTSTDVAEESCVVQYMEARFACCDDATLAGSKKASQHWLTCLTFDHPEDACNYEAVHGKSLQVLGEAAAAGGGGAASQAACGTAGASGAAVGD